LNRIEQAEPKMQKKLAKKKIDFFDLFGVGGAGWQCRIFFSFFYSCTLLKKKTFFIG